MKRDISTKPKPIKRKLTETQTAVNFPEKSHVSNEIVKRHRISQEPINHSTKIPSATNDTSATEKESPNTSIDNGISNSETKLASFTSKERESVNNQIKNSQNSDIALINEISEQIQEENSLSGV